MYNKELENWNAKFSDTNKYTNEAFQTLLAKKEELTNELS
jgi:hypothetical protein